MRRTIVAVAGVCFSVVAAVAGLGLRNVGAAANPGTPAFYTEQVRPMLMKNCGKCHFNMNHKGGLAMDTRASMMKGGRDGKVVIPGDPANSLIVRLARHQGPAKDPMPMPPKSPKMSDADIALIEQWVKAGAVMPDGIPK